MALLLFGLQFKLSIKLLIILSINLFIYKTCHNLLEFIVTYLNVFVLFDQQSQNLKIISL